MTAVRRDIFMWKLIITQIRIIISKIYNKSGAPDLVNNELYCITSDLYLPPFGVEDSLDVEATRKDAQHGFV
jgi:hypothetical protein